ncbi:MAG: UDP-3-O-acyl-N-acetylglucosamine deacetylase [Candidatus Aminicenantes bacterium]|nr:UDP-3-O-acyl-N-acetylglucosamine deacetylase [Candidatus Aminicenantes bacterium]
MYPGFKTQLTYQDETFSIVGFQLLSERNVKMTCRYRGDGGPAKFIVSKEEIPATVKYISNHEERGLTCIRKNGVEVKQVEHILSALCGMNVLDTDIYLEYTDGGEIDGPIAPPVLQLNCREFSLAIVSCFLNRNNKENKSAIDLNRAFVFVEKSEKGPLNDPACAIFAPLHKLHITAQINFPYFWGSQIYAETITTLDYVKNICWARSFFGTAFPHKAEWSELRKKYPGVLRERENHYRSIMLDYTQNKWITPLIVNTEPVRHKMLDFIGDLALLGVQLNAGIHIYKPHHHFNRECVIGLAEELGLLKKMEIL